MARIIINFILVISLSISPALAKVKKVAFDAQAAWTYVRDLSADEMRGRKSGQVGDQLSAQYIASKFKEWGLEPISPDGSYFQEFTIEHTHIEEGVFLEIVSPKSRRSFYYEQDWRAQSFSGSGNFAAEIVFAGYGIHAPQKGYDDYADVDVKGKWVLFSSDSPPMLQERLRQETDITTRIRAAQDHGARGALLFRTSDTEDTRGRGYRLGLKKEIYNKDFVILSLEKKVVDFIFEDLTTDLRYLDQQINATSIPASMETGTKAFVAVNVTFDEKRPTQNVIAKLTGTDKLLKEECIIIGAHMDHLGMNPYGDVMNGANDNASGTAVAMEVARVMNLNTIKPKRTVLFALWAGEEQGLLGARHYTENPLIPLDKTVAYINIDMVGHGSGKVEFPGIYYGPEVWAVLKDKLSKEILDYVRPGRGGPGGSDHTAFLSKGVPGFGIMTEGYHFKYHKANDIIDMINPDLLKKTGNFVEAAALILGSEGGNFFPPLRRETYYLKYQNLVNFTFPSVAGFIEKHREAQDSHVDVQLAVVEEKEGLAGVDLRVNILNGLLSHEDMLNAAQGLTFYSTGTQFNRDVRQGKTTILPGLKGISSFRDDPRWLEVLAKQGICFVAVDSPAGLFGENGLNEEGKKILDAVGKSGLLLVVSGWDEEQAKALLEGARKPLVLLAYDTPGKNVLDLIQKKGSALGLVLNKGEEAAAYFKKLDEVKKAVGSENLMIANGQCLWGTEGKEQMLKAISEILKEKYERGDISNLFSGTFLRVLGKARGEEPARPYAYIPF